MLRPILHTQITKDTIVTVAVAAFIIMALASRKVSSVLLFKPLHFLGKISYSFYLLHAVCLLSLVHLFYGKMPYGLIIPLVVAISFGVATLGYYGLEIPSIRLGKYLSGLEFIKGWTAGAPLENGTQNIS
jgi:peptidoglycan/LPS O-acetylase OafA/YrhL